MSRYEMRRDGALPRNMWQYSPTEGVCAGKKNRGSHVPWFSLGIIRMGIGLLHMPSYDV